MSTAAGDAWRIERGDWLRLEGPAKAVRMEVFVREQGIDQRRELDEWDAGCIHAVAWDAQGGPIGTGRLLPDDRIGRMAVLAPWRRRGVGAAILHELVAAARARGSRRVFLHAQASAIGFYERLGFFPEGPRFLEEGIEHQEMEMHLGSPWTAG